MLASFAHTKIGGREVVALQVLKIVQSSSLFAGHSLCFYDLDMSVLWSDFNHGLVITTLDNYDERIGVFKCHQAVSEIKRSVNADLPFGPSRERCYIVTLVKL